MQRLSKRWSKNTVAISIFLVLACASSVFAQSTPNDIANQLYMQIFQKYGTVEGLTTNAIIPMTTNTKMTTVDNSVSFYTATQMKCKSTKQFISISVWPLASGDIDKVIVSEDLNTDGGVDYSYTSPVIVSGICANGFISCDAGTWHNCTNWKWVSDSTGKIVIASTSNDQLGSCYCINNNCGSHAVMTQLSYILYSIGSGVVGALESAVGGKYAISDGVVNGMSINYTGQSTRDCANNSNAPSIGLDPTSVESLEGIFDNPAAITAITDSAISSAQSNTHSPYNQIVNSNSMNDKPVSSNNCSIIRNVSMADVTQVPYYVWLPWIQDTIQCFWGVVLPLSCIDTIQIDTNADGIFDTTTVRMNTDVQFPSETSHASVANSDISMEQQAYGIPSNWVQKIPGSESFTVLDGGGNGNSGNISTYSVQVKKITTPVCPGTTVLNNADILCYDETLKETMQDNCKSMASDANCKLRDETIDGVATLTNGVPTYANIPSSCRTVVGVVSSQTVCRDWWKKTRTYWCSGDTKYDFSFALMRAGKIQTSATTNGNTLLYTDVTTTNGVSLTYKNDSVLLGDLFTNNTGSNCVVACKTQMPSGNNKASDQTNATQNLTSTDSYDYFYKECVNKVCPVNSKKNEVVVTDCMCLNDAADVIAIMEVINNAEKDMICSDGTRN